MTPEPHSSGGGARGIPAARTPFACGCSSGRGRRMSSLAHSRPRERVDPPCDKSPPLTTPCKGPHPARPSTVTSEPLLTGSMPPAAAANNSLCTAIGQAWAHSSSGRAPKPSCHSWRTRTAKKTLDPRPPLGEPFGPTWKGCVLLACVLDARSREIVPGPENSSRRPGVANGAHQVS